MHLGSWVATLVFLPVFGLVMVIFDVAQRIARLFGQRPQEYVAGALQWTLVRAFGICDTRLAVERWIPSVSYNLRRGGHVLIDRSDAPAALEAIRALGRRVRNGGVSAMIFPEGTRARVGDLGPFKTAGTLALLEEAPDTP